MRVRPLLEQEKGQEICLRVNNKVELVLIIELIIETVDLQWPSESDWVQLRPGSRHSPRPSRSIPHSPRQSQTHLPRIQCLHFCIWTDRQWQNLHYVWSRHFYLEHPIIIITIIIIIIIIIIKTIIITIKEFVWRLEVGWADSSMPVATVWVEQRVE